MYFPNTFPLFQQDPVFVFRNYLSLMSMVNQSLHTSHCRGQRGRNFLSFQGRRGWTSELRSVNQTLFTLDFELWAKWLRDAKRVQRQWPPSAVLLELLPCSCPLLTPASVAFPQILETPSLLRVGFLFAFAGQTSVAYRLLLLATEALWRKENLPLATTLQWGAGITSPKPFTDWEPGPGGLKDSPQSSQWGRGRARVGSHGVDLYFRDTPSRFTWKTLFWTQRGCI